MFPSIFMLMLWEQYTFKIIAIKFNESSSHYSSCMFLDFILFFLNVEMKAKMCNSWRFPDYIKTGAYI